jgi:hypothetical protein
MAKKPAAGYAHVGVHGVQRIETYIRDLQEVSEPCFIRKIQVFLTNGETVEFSFYGTTPEEVAFTHLPDRPTSEE